ncbi:hypothetical protein TVAG_293040 [Trichomonas vaginalis G3]|uniref:Uncharacterized protein n=1 Tax=Trichomonas vaginalis (strain ATCC PRA-98 / G3) TaxID=412133 RepID=A2EWZ4_TRIV3|nr:hypothetical protein TVAGG3_0267760 [Trichomonas vaginalis G3]EAY02836.1 hypothetical protein TVAG_293040 [Trichomonas vaginalis G3]KAI5525628.1 hypothetical protein TVAGG3_0267760 [Trichomonas vaginalis G3]|eukprot:XP_001315059.1 hypothetical protein [Trichomonas vaginalis G3]
MCALMSGKFFFSKSLHQPELDDVCDTTKYIDYQRETVQTYGLVTKGLQPSKIPNRTIMFFGGRSTMVGSPSKTSTSKKSKKSKSSASSSKSEKHATFDLSNNSPIKSNNNDQTEISKITAQEEIVSSDDEQVQTLPQKIEKTSPQHEHMRDDDEVIDDEADDEDNDSDQE